MSAAIHTSALGLWGFRDCHEGLLVQGFRVKGFWGCWV